MGKTEIIDMALQLKAAERYEVVEKIMQSLDKPDPEIDRVWAAWYWVCVERISRRSRSQSEKCSTSARRRSRPD